MANRRMFSKEIISSDAFLNMGLGAQALYFHLGMNADDDGVVNNFKTIQRIIGANEDDLKVLLAKRFILPIDEAGIIIIKHWKINNYIQKDRYTPSKYKEDLKLIGIDENGAYTDDGYKMYTKCIHSIGKVSIDKSSKVINCVDNQCAYDENELDKPF